MHATKRTDQGALENPRVIDAHQRVKTAMETILVPIRDRDDSKTVKISAEIENPYIISYKNFLKNMPMCSNW